MTSRVQRRLGFTLIELLVVIAIIGILVGLTVPAVQKVRESAARLTCQNNLKQIGLALHSYENVNKKFPPGYVDGNSDPSSTPDNDLGPGWGWAAFLLPYLEQGNVYSQIDFKVGVGIGVNTQVSQQNLPVYQCPSDPYQQNVPIYDSTFTNPIATVAHGNYVGCNGVDECFGNAGGAGELNNGPFYRNSQTKIANVIDGTSNTIFVGERSANHSPSTWTGAVTGGRCPAWMATQPFTPPYTLPASALNTGNGTAYDNADFNEALVLAHGNATHLPSADFPIYDPDTFYSMHTGGANFLFGDGSVRFLSSGIDKMAYQGMCTIAGGETLPGTW